MTRDDAISRISIALHEQLKPADPIEVAKSAVSIATALDALGLLTHAIDVQTVVTEAVAILDRQDAASHHRVDPNTVSVPHPTTTTGQSAKPTDPSWQRLAAPDAPPGTA